MDPLPSPNSPGALWFARHGVYYTHGTVSQLAFSRAELLESLARLGVEPGPSGFGTQPIRPRSVRALDQVAPMLTRSHELNHFAQLMSTPTGLLLWRAEMAIKNSMAYLCRTAARSPAAESFTLPFFSWYLDRGSRDLHAAPPGPPPEWVRAGTVDHEGYARAIPGYLDATAAEVATLSQFVAALSGRQPLTMREFVELANRAFALLLHRHELDVDVRWTARALDAPSYLPPDGFTLHEILEAAARFAEFELLSYTAARPALLDEWRARSLFGVYRPAFDWLWTRFQNAEQCRLLIDAALLSPIDPVCAEVVGGELVVEDVLPGWRLPRLANALLDTFWSPSYDARQGLFAHELAERAGLAPPAAILQAMVDRPFAGSTAWTGSAIALGHAPDPDLPTPPTFVQDAVREALRVRQRDSQAVLATMDGSIVGIMPALEIFQDDVFFNGLRSHEGELPMEFYFHVLHSLVEGCVSAALIHGDPRVGYLEEMGRAFERGLERLGGSLEGEHISIRAMTERIIHPPFARSLVW